MILDLRHLKGKIKNIAKLSSNAGMLNIGLKVKELNETQIIKNIDNAGRKFKQYNEKYVTPPKRKRKSGKMSNQEKKAKQMKGKRLPINFVLTGKMTKAFDIISSGFGQVVIGFIGIDEKQKAGWNYKLRKFVGLTKKNKQKLFNWIYKKFIKT